MCGTLVFVFSRLNNDNNNNISSKRKRKKERKEERKMLGIASNEMR
jgi:hypothetical protein